MHLNNTISAARAALACGIFVASITSEVSAQHSTPTPGCGTRISRLEARTYEAFKSQIALFTGSVCSGSPTTSETYWIPIRFHVVRDSNGTGGWSPSRLSDAIGALDTAFATPTAAPPFHDSFKFFHTGAIDFIDNTSLRAIDDSVELEGLKSMNLTDDAIDLFIVDSFPAPGALGQPAGACGSSAFTFSDPAATGQAIVITSPCMPGGQPSNDSTLPHQVGHYFDLLHTHETIFGPDCLSTIQGSPLQSVNEGDLVIDTVPSPVLGQGNVNFSPTSACSFKACTANCGPIDPACGDITYAAANVNTPPANNFMDSVDIETCRNTFTCGQIIRAAITLVTIRSGASGNLPSWAVLPIITTDPTTDCNGNGVRDDFDIALGTEQDINVNDLPDSCELFCQDDLGFGGPGAFALSVCGFDLVDDAGLAQALITGGSPGRQGILVLSFTFDPAPLFGGTLAPGVPFLSTTPFLFDANGEFGFAVPGSSGVATDVYAQIAVPASGPDPAGLSNALRIVIGL